MNKNFALLSIGAALFFSLCVVDLGHAAQPQKGQAAPILMAGDMKATATAPTTQVSTASIPCGGRTGVKNPALPGGAFVNQEGIYLRFATSCHSSPLFRAGHPGRSS